MFVLRDDLLNLWVCPKLSCMFGRFCHFVLHLLDVVVFLLKEAAALVIQGQVQWINAVRGELSLQVVVLDPLYASFKIKLLLSQSL